MNDGLRGPYDMSNMNKMHAGNKTMYSVFWRHNL